MNQYNVLILDILHLVYRGVRPKDLVRDQARVGYHFTARRVSPDDRDRWINLHPYSKPRERVKRWDQRTYLLDIRDSEPPSRSKL